MSIPDVPAPATPADNALFSILNEENPIATIVEGSTDAPAVTEETSSSDLNGADNLLSVLVTEESAPESRKKEEGEVSSVPSLDGGSTFLSDITTGSDTPLPVSTETPPEKANDNIMDTLYPNPENNNRPLIPTSASKLKDTLEKFISELESLEIEDEK